MLKSDETLDFHNKLIADVALGEKCPNKERSSVYILDSPLGNVYTNACPDGLHCVKLYGNANYDDINWDVKVDFIRSSLLAPSNPHAKQLKKWLQMYFSNPVKCKDIEIAFCGLKEYGEFNSNIWMTIYRHCPPGDLMSYSELALSAGLTAGASKVVGYAINKNPYMLVVGDHRIVKASGEIWCENESQRNKLRRLLVKYELGDAFDDALLRVKERNEQSKGTRRRNTGGSKKRVKTETNEVVETKPKVGKSAKATQKRATRRASRSRRREDESDDYDSDEVDDDQSD